MLRNLLPANRRSTVPSVLAFALLSLLGVVQAQAHTLTYSFFAPAQTFPAHQMERWAEEVEARTEGRVQVNTFPGGTLLTAPNTYDGVQAGVADIGLSATAYEPGRFPLLNLAGNLTGIEVNSTVASQVVYDLIQEFPADELGLGDFQVITAFTSEPGYLQTVNPIRTLEDLRGQEIRVAGDSTDTLDALGATPVGLSQAETGEALQTGVVRGYVSSREVLMDLQFARNVNYMTAYPMSNVVFVAAMNRERFDSLPEDIQKVLLEVGAEMAHFTGDYLDNHIEDSLEWAASEHGFSHIELTQEEIARWDERLEPLNEKRIQSVADRGLPAEAFVDRMMELIDYYQAQ